MAIRATHGRRSPYKHNLDQGLGQQSACHALIPSNNSSSHHASSYQIYAEYPQPQRPLCANWRRGHGLQNPDLHNTTLWEPSLESWNAWVAGPGGISHWRLHSSQCQWSTPYVDLYCYSVLLRFSQRPILKTAAIV